MVPFKTFSSLFFIVTCGGSAPVEKEAEVGSWWQDPRIPWGALEEMFPSWSAFGRAGTTAKGTKMLVGTTALPE